MALRDTSGRKQLCFTTHGDGTPGPRICQHGRGTRNSRACVREHGLQPGSNFTLINSNLPPACLVQRQRDQVRGERRGALWPLAHGQDRPDPHVAGGACRQGRDIGCRVLEGSSQGPGGIDQVLSAQQSQKVRPQHAQALRRAPAAPGTARPSTGAWAAPLQAPRTPTPLLPPLAAPCPACRSARRCAPSARRMRSRSTPSPPVGAAPYWARRLQEHNWLPEGLDSSCCQRGSPDGVATMPGRAPFCVAFTSHVLPRVYGSPLYTSQTCHAVPRCAPQACTSPP